MNLSMQRLVLCGLLMASGASLALTTERIFQDARIVDEERSDDRHYLLPLGRVKYDRSLGRDVPARYKRMDGEFEAIVWELTGGEPLPEAKQRIDAHLEDPRFELLFQCQSRDCGESFAWANSVFEKPILYGNDRSQNLWVIKDVGAQVYHVFYLVERPNRRKYLYEETFKVPDLILSDSVIKEALERDGYLILGEIPVNAGAPEFADLIERLKPHVKAVPPQLLVIHRHGSANQVPMLEPLRKALAQAGIEAQVEDLGNSAPRPHAPARAWLEWVDPEWQP